LRKIVRLNFRQSSLTNLGHPGCFIERKISRSPRLLKFFPKTLDCHRTKCRLNGGVEIDQNLAWFRAFAGTQNTALLQNINDARSARVTKSQPALK